MVTNCDVFTTVGSAAAYLARPMSKPLPATAVAIQQAIDKGLTTWPEFLRMLRTELHIPEGAIAVWRAGDRDLAAVLVEWVEEEARVRQDNAYLGNA